MNNKIKNPCIHVCTKDENGICLGCFRSIEEIRLWYNSSDDEKLKIIAKADKRLVEFDKKLPYI
ncbi:MAG: DUF1289 domain-containing protein [Chlorobi bacterium]|nr:DUF1289 domain-containing protein [Chlorobiota bacterium]